ncbi:4820_t:CDS:2 [Dentiscutata erythropus]|uniref:4820_t:CDS:1 n=1 Tax=Dentiscutata erythropus TaxID=1348616 RepID=A0A9N9BUK1_9GLOM|nr:4820_t:CDS:2 [Dentiscutata erythropus]
MRDAHRHISNFENAYIISRYGNEKGSFEVKSDSPSGSTENYPRIQRQRPGDWICKSCGINNFAYRTECFECGEKVQNREVAPGDWICPKCEFYNFQSRLACFKCHTPAPNFEQNPNKDHQEN